MGFKFKVYLSLTYLSTGVSMHVTINTVIVGRFPIHAIVTSNLHGLALREIRPLYNTK